MIDIEHGPLRALKHNGFARSNGLVDQQGRVGDEWSNFFSGARIFVIHAIGVERFGVE